MKELVTLLVKCDNDFYRPLSEDIESNESLEVKLEKVILKKSLCNTEFITLYSDVGDLIGFTMMNVNYELPVGDMLVASHYISLTVISPNERNKGCASFLYKFIENHYKEIAPYVITRRTWSLNTRQMHINEKLDFALIYTDYNHKDINVDSLYYIKKFQN